jgi:hypothetical protein
MVSYSLTVQGHLREHSNICNICSLKRVLRLKGVGRIEEVEDFEITERDSYSSIETFSVHVDRSAAARVQCA